MRRLSFRAVARSDVGRRANNEDAVLASPRLVAVADGVGGAAAGEVASATVIMALAHLDKCRLEGSLDEALPGAIAQGNDRLQFVAGARPELAGMSTTLTTVALSDDGRYLVANVGDSRTYLYRDGDLRQLTRDDSLVQALLEGGAITPAQAATHPQRSIVLEALDGRPRPSVATQSLQARAGDRLLLCSDGLSDALDGAGIASGLAIASAPAAADALVARALSAGATDNVTVIVADVVPAPSDDGGWRGHSLSAPGSAGTSTA